MLCSLALAIAPVSLSGGVTLSLADDAPAVELTASAGVIVDTVYRFELKYDWLQDLEPATERASWSAADFRPFLPDGAVEVGDVWDVDPTAALPFLRQLLPGATSELHHGRMNGVKVSPVAVEGTKACLRALGERHAEVLIRAHAEFRIDLEEGDEPAWMTPSQFAGRLLVDRERGHVLAFELAVPERSANVDLNAPGEHGTMADIGRIEGMRVRGGSPPADVAFETELTGDEASALLAKGFYGFAEIDWLSLEQALAEARLTERPLHVVVMFGALDDESC